jgi:hypothetical protein
VSDPVDFLCAIYCNEELPLSVRMRAAIEAAPYLHPKLNAIAVGNINGNDIASLLDRAIARSNTAMKIIEHSSEPAHNGDGHLTQNGQQPSQHTQEGQGNSSNASPVVVTTNPAAPFPRLRR